MNELEAKRIVSVLSWISKYQKIPKVVSEQAEGSLRCSGIVSKSEIRISLGDLFVTVDRDTHYGIMSDPKRQFVYAEVSDGGRLQCNLDEYNQILSASVLSGGPTGEITVTAEHDTATARYFGSSTEFKLQ